MTLIVFLPLAGALLLGMLPHSENGLLRGFGLAISGSTFLLALLLWSGFDPQNTAMQFTEEARWIPASGIGFRLGVDGISMPFVLLATFLVPMVLLSSIDTLVRGVKGFVFCALILESAMLGILTALDLFLFYIFWELALIPLFFFVTAWGRSNRSYSAVKLFVYLASTSLMMLLTIIFLHIKNDSAGLAIDTLTRITLDPQVQMWLFGGMMIAFAAHAAVFPLHTWLTDAQTEMEPAASALLSGLFIKLGAYGLLRFVLPLFPTLFAAFTPVLAILAVAGLIYCSLAALGQKSLRRMAAFILAAQMGLAVLGIAVMNVEALTGALYLMICSGVSGSALFMIIALIEKANGHDRVDRLGNSIRTLPFLGMLLVLAALGLGGVPGLSGFAGNIYLLYGAFAPNGLMGSAVLAFIACFGLLLMMVALMLMVQKMMAGNDKRPAAEAARVGLREHLVIVPMIILIILMGIMPSYFIKSIAGASEKIVESYRSQTQTALEMRDGSTSPVIGLVLKSDNDKAEE